MAELTVTERRFTFRQPLATSFGTLTERTVLEVALVGADGVVGTGEAAPLESYDGVSLDEAASALSRYAEVIDGLDDGQQILAACQEAGGPPQALAAIDLALWDRAGRRDGKPVCELLADHPAAEVPVNATIGALPPESAERAAAEAAAAGFRCVKVKVGTGDDAARLAAVRAGGGPGLEIRIDANGAWSADDAAELLPLLSAAAGGLELVEEPVSGERAFRRLAETAFELRLSADESGVGTAQTTCLKIGRCGGISGLCAQAAYAQAFGGEVYLASTFDGPLGIAAALHCAAALDVELPCGLATLHAFTDSVPEALAASEGRIAVPRGPGLLG